MIDSLIKELKDQIGNQILEKTEARPNQLDAIFSVIGDATKKEVSTSMLKGGLGTVMNLFSNKQNNTQAEILQNSISNKIVSGLIEKLGFNSSTASLISGMALPVLMNLITKKNNETPEDDSSPLENLFGDKKSHKGLTGKLFKNLLNLKK